MNNAAGGGGGGLRGAQHSHNAGGGGGQSSSPGASQTAWFLGTPVTKAYAYVMVGLYVTAELGNYHDTLALDMDGVLNEGEAWRLITCHITFSTIGEMIFGMLLLCPLMRQFEREMGSRKFGTFSLFSIMVASSWELLLSQLFFSSSDDDDSAMMVIRASGPYSLIGALLHLFHRYTPRLHPRFVSILGLEFSEKAMTYFLALQLLCSQGSYTIIPSICGFLGGYMCTAKSSPLSKWELPNIVYRLCACVGAPFVESTTPPVVQVGVEGLGGVRRHRGGTGGGGGGGGMGLHQRPAVVVPGAAGAAAQQQPQPPAEENFANLPPPPPPPEEVVENLVSMGFARDAVVRVLGQCDNNPEVAANRLLNEG